MQKEEDDAEVEEEITPGEVVQGLPEYTKADVAKHKTPESGIWVTYKNGKS